MHIHHPASADVTMNYWNAMCCSTETWTDFPEAMNGWNTSDICGTGQHFNERMKATAPFSLKHNASNRNNKSYFCQGDMFYNCKAFAAKNVPMLQSIRWDPQNIKYFRWWRSSNEKTIATNMSSVHFCKIMAVVQTQTEPRSMVKLTNYYSLSILSWKLWSINTSTAKRKRYYP